MLRNLIVGRRSRRAPAARELASGFLTLSLLACGSEGGGPLVPPAPGVARVRVEAPAGAMRVGESVRWSAEAVDSAGRPVPTGAFSWTSSAPAVAAVDSSGRVTARAPGTAEIRAAVAGRTGSAAVLVLAPEVVRLVASPALLVVDAGSEGRIGAAALTAAGDSVAGAPVAWESLDPATAGVDAQGRVRGVAPGIGWVVARSGALADSAVVAVLGPASVVARALPGGEPRREIATGQTLPVSVELDLSRVSPSGDLGSVEADLLFDPAVLRVDSVRIRFSGAGDSHLVSSGRLRLAFAATAAQGTPSFALATVFVTAAPGAPGGSGSRLRLEFAERPRSTAFADYPAPLSIPGRVRIAPRP